MSPEPDTPANHGAKRRLLENVASLDDAVCAVLETIVAGLSVRVEEAVEAGSDIVTPAFAKNFRTRLQLHHATHEEVFKKKTFEFAFKAASVATGRRATMDANATSAGYDVMVDAVRYSLKTEAGTKPSKTHIKISKLMEARWIRECRTGKDYLRNFEVVRRHFSHYDRVLVLRAFRVDEPFPGVRYDLWEIPHALLKLVEGIKAKDFSPRKEKSGTSTVQVRMGDQPVYKLRLDGSVEKITLEGLQVARCARHASWTVESLIADSLPA